MLWCEIRLRCRVPTPQQEHTAFQAESFVLAQRSQLAPSRFLPLLATSTPFFSNLRHQEGHQVKRGTGQMHSEVCLV